MIYKELKIEDINEIYHTNYECQDHMEIIKKEK